MWLYVAWYSGDTNPTILWDERAEERYLMLPDLGKVLQGLRRALPGMCCFQKKTASMNLEHEHVCYWWWLCPPSQLLCLSPVTSHQIYWNVELQTWLWLHQVCVCVWGGITYFLDYTWHMLRWTTVPVVVFLLLHQLDCFSNFSHYAPHDPYQCNTGSPTAQGQYGGKTRQYRVYKTATDTMS